jgi:hypothetical protein
MITKNYLLDRFLAYEGIQIKSAKFLKIDYLYCTFKSTVFTDWEGVSRYSVLLTAASTSSSPQRSPVWSPTALAGLWFWVITPDPSSIVRVPCFWGRFFLRCLRRYAALYAYRRAAFCDLRIVSWWAIQYETPSRIDQQPYRLELVNYFDSLKSGSWSAHFERLIRLDYQVFLSPREFPLQPRVLAF